MALAVGLVLSLVPPAGRASNFELINAGVQIRISERTILGQQSLESFREYDLTASFATPWEREVVRGMSVGARVLGSVGILEGADERAGVASAIPLLAVGTPDRRLTIDGGAGLALLGRYDYPQQDFGGHVQFALTAGIEGPLYRRIGLGYRFMHYSDAGMYGPGTIGADLHMGTLTYRF